ncbi:hypothetical protein [Denitromonas halophila]|uniref:Uncharacterized protein n=1 Tax=Denitromonas halophila TaxID=1629404 RepID=A0A557QSP6_9RHOO|nr:hypothetical protein [Denitromonas halophila]TVO55919.1 hypothetical protein FHP91_11960 [Denitromonas halophila]
MKRIERKAKVGDNLSNEYEQRGLGRVASKLADDEIALSAKRAAEDKSRRTAPTTLALIEEARRAKWISEKPAQGGLFSTIVCPRGEACAIKSRG